MTFGLRLIATVLIAALCAGCYTPRIRPGNFDATGMSCEAIGQAYVTNNRELKTLRNRAIRERGTRIIPPGFDFEREVPNLNAAEEARQRKLISRTGGIVNAYIQRCGSDQQLRDRYGTTRF